MAIPECTESIDSISSSRLGDDARSEHHLYREGVERRSDGKQSRDADAGSTKPGLVAALDRHPNAEPFERERCQAELGQAGLLHAGPEGGCGELHRVYADRVAFPAFVCRGCSQSEDSREDFFLASRAVRFRRLSALDVPTERGRIRRTLRRVIGRLLLYGRMVGVWPRERTAYGGNGAGVALQGRRGLHHVECSLG